MTGFLGGELESSLADALFPFSADDYAIIHY